MQGDDYGNANTFTEGELSFPDSNNHDPFRNVRVNAARFADKLFGAVETNIDAYIGARDQADAKNMGRDVTIKQSILPAEFQTFYERNKTLLLAAVGGFLVAFFGIILLRR